MSSSYCATSCLQGRAGADQAHVSGEHVDQLGELVEGEATHPLTGRRDARVVLHLEQPALVALLGLQRGEQCLGVVDHRAELPAAEGLPVATDAGLAEQDRPAVVLPHPEGGEGEDRREEDQQAEGADDVEGALGAAYGLGGSRLLQVDQRHPADRSDADALTGDVGDARRDDDGDVLVLEVPGEPAHLGGGAERATGEEDDVGVGLDGDLGDRARGAEQRDAGVGCLCGCRAPGSVRR